MGREVRMVPPNWEHPVKLDEMGRERPQPMFDQTYADACEKWLAEFDRIRSGGASEIEAEVYPGGVCDWAFDNRVPDPDCYRPWTDGEATWFQLWETVSEGTPVSPPFPTKEALIDYLAENGDFWDQSRCKRPDLTTLWGGTPGVSGWGKARAERFVMGPGWAPSFVLVARNGVLTQGHLADLPPQRAP